MSTAGSRPKEAAGVRGDSPKKDSIYRSKSFRAFSIALGLVIGRYRVTAFIIYLLKNWFVFLAGTGARRFLFRHLYISKTRAKFFPEEIYFL
jgi:hypothetical protein